MQHYVMGREGYYEDIPADVTVGRFRSGPSVVKTFSSGDVGVALFGISPAMVLVDKGTDAGILAAKHSKLFSKLRCDSTNLRKSVPITYATSAKPTETVKYCELPLPSRHLRRLLEVGGGSHSRYFDHERGTVHVTLLNPYFATIAVDERLH